MTSILINLGLGATDPTYYAIPNYDPYFVGSHTLYTYSILSFRTLK